MSTNLCKTLDSTLLGLIESSKTLEFHHHTMNNEQQQQATKRRLAQPRLVAP